MHEVSAFSGFFSFHKVTAVQRDRIEMKTWLAVAASAAAVACKVSAASGAPAAKLPVPAYALLPRVRVIDNERRTGVCGKSERVIEGESARVRE
jgi:hypothetical protein